VGKGRGSIQASTRTRWWPRLGRTRSKVARPRAAGATAAASQQRERRHVVLEAATGRWWRHGGRCGLPAVGRGRRRTQGPAVVEKQQQRCCSATMARPRERERRGWKREKWRAGEKGVVFGCPKTSRARRGGAHAVSRGTTRRAVSRTGRPRYSPSGSKCKTNTTAKITETAIFSRLQLSNRWMICLSDFTFV
jgi:hypothetical protein